MGQPPMTTPDVTTQPLPPERSIYMQRAAAQATKILERFSSGPIKYCPTTLQLLDEWIDRMERNGPLPSAARVLVIAFLGQTFLHRHGGYWAAQVPYFAQQHTVVTIDLAGHGE